MSGLQTRQVLTFQGYILFTGDRQTLPITIKAFDMTGAAAKLARIVSDQPGEAIGIQLRQVKETLIVPANGASINHWGRRRGPNSGS